MKTLSASLVAFLCASVVFAQTASDKAMPAPTGMPKMPPVPSGKMPTPGKDMTFSGPCASQQKAAMAAMQKVRPATPPTKGALDKNAKPNVPAELKALQDCLSKNAPKAPPTAPIKPPASDKNAKIIDPTKLAKPDKAPPPAAVIPAKGQKPVIANANAKTTTCPVVTKVLKMGDTDKEVAVLKQFLAKEGLLQGAQGTEFFGKATTDALKAWQKKQGIPQSGETDKKTQDALKNCAKSAGRSTR